MSQIDENVNSQAENTAETAPAEATPVVQQANACAAAVAPAKTEIMQGEMEETYREMSPMRLIMRRFFRSKLSIVGLVMIISLFLFSFLGPAFFADSPDDKGKYDPQDGSWGETERDFTPSYTTRTTIYNEREVVDENGNPVDVTEVYEYMVPINAYASPSGDHFLGTDEEGYDVFVRLMYGGRISLTIGFVVVILETLIGVVLGGISGYFGGWVDQVIMRIVDIFNCVPTLPILLIASAVIDAWSENWGENAPTWRIMILMVVITLFSWSGTARMVRGQILSLREQEYMTATEVMGMSAGRKIFRHLIPNVMPQLIVSMTLGLGSVILYESTLSYLGLGVQKPQAAWGTMIAAVNDPVVLSYHTNVWLPAGIMIVIAVLGFNFIGDGLRDAMDPKARK